MNQLQVLKKLIPIYTEAINRIADGEELWIVLRNTHTDEGICHCYSNHFGDELMYDEWVREVNQNQGATCSTWYRCVGVHDGIFNAIECLSYRLTIMQLMVMDLTNKKEIVY